jgi:hypothetical protein
MSKTMNDFYMMEEALVKERKEYLKERTSLYGLILLNIALLCILAYVCNLNKFIL